MQSDCQADTTDAKGPLDITAYQDEQEADTTATPSLQIGHAESGSIKDESL